jgi:hypothetical protein
VLAAPAVRPCVHAQPLCYSVMALALVAPARALGSWVVFVGRPWALGQAPVSWVVLGRLGRHPCLGSSLGAWAGTRVFGRAPRLRRRARSLSQVRAKPKPYAKLANIRARAVADGAALFCRPGLLWLAPGPLPLWGPLAYLLSPLLIPVGEGPGGRNVLPPRQAGGPRKRPDAFSSRRGARNHIRPGTRSSLPPEGR